MTSNAFQQDRPESRAKARSFGQRAALTVEASPLMKGRDIVGSTVNLDVAPRVADQVDWTNKVTLQLSEDELMAFASVLLGLLPSYHFKRPGKGIEVERQNGKIFVKATAGVGRNYVLPLPPGRVFATSMLVLKQLQVHFDAEDVQVVVVALRGAAALMSLATKLS